MSDRLAELRRQRTVVLEQLMRLDREIAQAAAAPAAAKPPAPPVAPGGVSSAAPAPAVATGVAEAILEEYRVPPEAVHRNVRKGCLLYFAAALVALGLALVVLYFTIGTR